MSRAEATRNSLRVADRTMFTTASARNLPVVSPDSVLGCSVGEGRYYGEGDETQIAGHVVGAERAS